MMFRRLMVFSCCLLLGLGFKRKPEAPGPTAARQAAPEAEIVTDFPIGDKSYEKRLRQGFYENSGDWRWTARIFSVTLDPPPGEEAAYLELDLGFPTELMNAVGNVTLVARVSGKEVGRKQFAKTGRQFLSFSVPAKLLQKRPVVVVCELDKTFRDPANGGRETGLIAVGMSLKPYQESAVGRETEMRLARQGYQKLVEQRRARLPLERQNEMMKLFHELPIWRHMWFHNVRIEKNPLDLRMMQQIIYELQPEFIVETGTFNGGSALYWAHTLNGIPLADSRVLTVDIGDQTKTAAGLWLWKKYVTFLLGSSTDPAIVARIAQAVKGHKTLVVLDSDHSMAHVLNELRLYSPLVTRSSYLIVEDTHIDGVPTMPEAGPGPMAAVLRFLKEDAGREFEQDLTREALVMTFNPGGWLQRR